MASDRGAQHNPFSQPSESPALADRHPPALLPYHAPYHAARDYTPRLHVAPAGTAPTPLAAAAKAITGAALPLPPVTAPASSPASVDVVADEFDTGDLPAAPLVFADVPALLTLRVGALGSGGGGTTASPATDVATFAGPRVAGSLSATAYALFFTRARGQVLPAAMRHLPRGYCTVPVQLISRVELRRVDAAAAAAAAPPVLGSSAATPAGGGAASPAPLPPAAALPPVALLEVHCKDVRTLVLGFVDEAAAEGVAARLRFLAFPRRPELQFLAFAAPPPSPLLSGVDPQPQDGWRVYEPLAELRRLGVVDSGALSGGGGGGGGERRGSGPWRVSVANAAWELCPSYPAVLAVPAAISDTDLTAAAAFRARARVPVLTWRHPTHGSTLWRSSQPLVGVLGGGNAADEALLRAIRAGGAALPSRDPSLPALLLLPLLVADCRPFVNSLANRAGGGGTERYDFCAVEHLGMPNIHALRDAYRRLTAACALGPPPGPPAAGMLEWVVALGANEWTAQVRTALAGGLLVAEALHRRGQSVLVHCSDGWDRTAQVATLAQLLLDPFFRTARGFCCLVAKEWGAYGHQFAARCGHGSERTDDVEAAPVFLLLLDAVTQLVRLFPAAFEFSPRLPLLLAHHAFTCRFGTFLGDCERERTLAGLPYRTPSLWGHVLTRRGDWASHEYAAALAAGTAPDALLPHPVVVLRGVALWDDWFLRYAPVACLAECWPPAVVPGPGLVSPSSSGAGAGGAAAAAAAADCYPEGSYDRAALAVARSPGML